MNDPFKVIYYPNSEPPPFTLARSILVFDEISFFDHPSITFEGAGTVGHDSAIRNIVEPLKKEGYKLNVLKPEGGRVYGELERLIDADLNNHEFRKVFFQLIKNDPSFLVNMAPNGKYGHYGSAENLRRMILNTKPNQVPHTVSEIKLANYSNGIPPEIWIAMAMAQDSYKLTLSSYLAIDQDIQLFGDNRAMDMLLKAKFNQMTDGNQKKNITHMVVFKLLENLVPVEAFNGKNFIDIVRFRNKMDKERKKLKERVLEISSEIEELQGDNQQAKVDEILYKYLIPEAREFQNKLADNWDNFFKESSKALILNSKQLAIIVATILPVSLPTAILASIASLGTTVMPFMVDYLKEKEKIDRRNPYSYLMKFK